MKKLLIIFALCAIPSFSQAAIALVATSTIDSTSGAQTTKSITFTVSSVTNGAMFAVTTGRDYAVNRVIWDPTGANQSMTRLIDSPNIGDYLSIWYLANPTPATASLIAYSDSNPQIMYLGTNLYSGATQSTPTITGSGTNTISLTSTVDTSAMFVFAYSAGTITAGSGATRLVLGNGMATLQSNPLSISPAGSKTMGITSASNSYGVIFGPDVAPPSGTNISPEEFYLADE